jgi:hypothetical protein
LPYSGKGRAVGKANISYIGSFAIIMMKNSVYVNKSIGSGLSRERFPNRYAVAPYVRFDERGWETGFYNTAPILEPTKYTKSLFCRIKFGKRKDHINTLPEIY